MFTDYCPTCGEDRKFHIETREHDFKVRADVIRLKFPQGVCSVCGEVVNDPSFGDPLEKVYAIYRQKHGLLCPAEIRQIREQYDLSHEVFAEALGMSPATLYRYEAGALQDVTHDQLLRMCRIPANMLEAYKCRCTGQSSLKQKHFYAVIAALMPPAAAGETKTPQWVIGSIKAHGARSLKRQNPYLDMALGELRMAS